MNYELRKHGFALARNMGKMPMLRRGFTLVELLVVIAIIALLVVVAIPSARALKGSYESTGAEAMISSALSSARAIAAKGHCYAGVRFQKAYDATKPVVDQPQYIIFIVNDTNATGLADGFQAVPGLKPVKLPDNMGVMDFRLRTSASASISNDAVIDTDGEILNDDQLRDTTTFSILFSPTGKLIIHEVRIRNKNGEANTSILSHDEVFNTENNVTAVNPIGMFIQDDYANLGLGQERSRSSFIIYDKEKFKIAYKNGTAWWDYLRNVPVVHINQYTGTIIEK